MTTIHYVPTEDWFDFYYGKGRCYCGKPNHSFAGQVTDNIGLVRCEECLDEYTNRCNHEWIDVMCFPLEKKRHLLCVNCGKQKYEDL